MELVNEIQSLEKLASNTTLPKEVSDNIRKQIQLIKQQLSKAAREAKRTPKVVAPKEVKEVKEVKAVEPQTHLDGVKIKDMTKTQIKEAPMLYPEYKLKSSSGIFRHYEATYYDLGEEQNYYLMLHQMREHLITLLTKEHKEHSAIKFGVSLVCSYAKQNGTDVPDYTSIERKTRRDLLFFNESDIISNADAAINMLQDGFDNFNFVQMGSGWVFEGGKRSDVTVLTFNPFRGESYIKTPDYVPARSVINVQNKDEQCFKWAVLSALYPVADHPERVTKYTPYENKLNWTGVKFPASLKDVAKFEVNNPDISICVYRYEGKNPRPVFISKRMNKAEPTYREVDLLLIVEDEKQGEHPLTKQHYVWIKNFDTFCHRYNKSDHKKYTCRRCLKVFSAEQYRIEHLVLCEGINKGAQIIQMPKKGEVLEFTDGHKLLKAPFIIYADFECFNDKRDEPNFKHPCEDLECEDPDCIREKKRMKRTIQTTEQEANSYCYCVVRSDGQIRGPFLYRGPDAVDHFFEAMEEEIDLIYKVFDDPKPIIIDDTVYDAQENATACWACEKELGEDRVMHHDHITASLDSLVSVLKEEDLVITREKISDVYTKEATVEKYAELFGLLRQKGTYPYEYVSDYEKFNDTTLPPIESFYSNLSKSGIDMKEYQHAQNVWNKFECTTLGEYHDIYLKTDVLLLADVFEKFRKVIINYFKLDPAHFISAAGLSWSAMLRMTKVKLELISDVDMHMFIEKGIRGGISTVATKRYAQANNKYLPDYKPEDPESYIMYFDANSLYAAAMSKKLPTHNFTWRPELVGETPEQMTEVLDLIMTTDFDDDIERIYEVDLKYPPELHDLHNDYPLAPEAMVVDDSMYSEYQQMVAQKINKKILANMKRYRLGERPEITVGAELPEAPVRQLPLEETPAILSLKSENNELRRQIELMRNEVTHIRSSLRRHEIEIRVLRGTSYDGAIIWKVQPISTLFMEDPEKKDLPDTHYSGKEIFSIPFYSGRYGYRYNLGASINPRQGNMRIFLMLNRGEYDALLPWPLEFQSTVTIIPPTGSAEQPIILDMEARSMKSPQPHLPITYKYALVLDLQKLCKFASHDTIFCAPLSVYIYSICATVLAFY
ncbi:hypothetical protein EMCRGX_G007882 [Ephydatia muelleri]